MVRRDPVLPSPANSQDSKLLRGEGAPAEKIAQFEEAGTEITMRGDSTVPREIVPVFPQRQKVMA